MATPHDVPGHTLKITEWITPDDQRYTVVDIESVNGEGIYQTYALGMLRQAEAALLNPAEEIDHE